MSGFTGSGHPKCIPGALARRIVEARQQGKEFQIQLFTGASTGPELDGVLAESGGVQLRLPYQSDPEMRKRINNGEIDYTDIHLGHLARFARLGVVGKPDIAIIEVTAVLEDGRLVPSSSIGMNNVWLECADQVILEVNSWQPAQLEGMHDIYDSGEPWTRCQPVPITHPGQRIGSPYFRVPLDKIIGIVLTDVPDRNSAYKQPDEKSHRIAGHILEFLGWEVKKGRIPPSLLPLQSGVGNIANAVLYGLQEGPFEGMTAYTEVIQDGMMKLLQTGKLTHVSATALSLGPEMFSQFVADIDEYRKGIVLRPQEISNNPEVIRRLGVIAMNGMIEADIYGNVNSTHIMGSRIQNGIGGSGDFGRNSYVSIFMAPSTAQSGKISTIVPMVSHVDHTEHDVQVIVTEQGLADLRGLSPRQRAKLILERCVHPDFRPALLDYFERAGQLAYGKHTPHLLPECLSWHSSFITSGTMCATNRSDYSDHLTTTMAVKSAHYALQAGRTMSFTLKTTAFADNREIPNKYTCDGGDVSPALNWNDAPAGTQSFALIADDPDALVGTWTHWIIWNIPAKSVGLPEGVPNVEESGDGTRQGKNDFKRIGYGGPCPPAGKPHRYFFKLYALDAKLDVKAGASRKELERDMKRHVLSHAESMGKYGR
jgi:succinyl-CoA:acetate CoA-transferase